VLSGVDQRLSDAPLPNGSQYRRSFYKIRPGPNNVENVIHTDHSIRVRDPERISRSESGLKRRLARGYEIRRGIVECPTESVGDRTCLWSYCEVAVARHNGYVFAEAGLAGWSPGGIGAGVSFDEALIPPLALIAVTT